MRPCLGGYSSAVAPQSTMLAVPRRSMGPFREDRCDDEIVPCLVDHVRVMYMFSFVYRFM